MRIPSRPGEAFEGDDGARKERTKRGRSRGAIDELWWTPPAVQAGVDEVGTCSARTELYRFTRLWWEGSTRPVSVKRDRPGRPTVLDNWQTQ